MLSLLENATLVASAPGGTAALRSLVLQLAMRGLLSTTEAGDTPVESLLEQIRRAKQQLHESGQLKRLRTVEPVAADDPPYPLPPTWRWIRLAEVGHDWGQQEPTAAFTYIDVGSLDNKAGEIRSPQVVSASDASSRARKLVHQGTLIYSTIRPYLLNVAVLEQEFDPQPIASTAFAVIHPYCAMPSRFFFWWLRSPAFIRYVESVQTGIAYPAINDAQFFNGLTPLPPLEEQHRIVAKVDELMALCDRLEARQQNAEAAHAGLVQALLDGLTQARDAEEFQACWQRLAERIGLVLTTDESVDAVKQAVLRLAFSGRLLGEAFASAEGSQTALPDGWREVQIADIAVVGTGATPARTNPAYFDPPEFPWVTSGETSAELINATAQRVSALALAETNLTMYPPGTLIVAMYGQGKTRGQVSELAIEACTNQACAAIQLKDSAPSHRQYVKYFFEKSYDELRELAAGGAQPNLNLGKIKSTLIPLPPPEEQCRIVAKVTELLALCDQLKARIAAARATHAQLAEALVADAVA